MRSSIVALAVLAGLLATLTTVSVVRAQSCSGASYGSERSKLDRLLMSRSYAKAERTFLLGGADRRVRDLKQSALNERGERCGIEPVRAHVIGCVAAQLPRVAAPKRPTGKSLWGKANVLAREAAFIGTFQACSVAAKQALFKR